MVKVKTKAEIIREINKYLEEFLEEIKRIKIEHDKKINTLIKEIETRRIKEIQDSLKNLE